jgi:hypothetical protein
VRRLRSLRAGDSRGAREYSDCDGIAAGIKNALCGHLECWRYREQGQPQPALFVGRGRQGNVHSNCALLPRTWNNPDLVMATRCSTFHSLQIFVYIYCYWITISRLLLELRSVPNKILEEKALWWPRVGATCSAITDRTQPFDTWKNRNHGTLPCFRNVNMCSDIISHSSLQIAPQAPREARSTSFFNRS